MKSFWINHCDMALLLNDVLLAKSTFRFHAQGRSMWPFIRSGDFLTIQRLDKQILRCGSVVLYQTVTGQLIAHRIVSLSMTEWSSGVKLRVRGDRLLAPIEIIGAEQLLGTVVAVERDGKPLVGYSNGQYILVICWIGLLRPPLRKMYSLAVRIKRACIRFTANFYPSIH